MHVFTIPGVKAFLSEKLYQDLLERFFRCQRQHGGVNENPGILFQHPSSEGCKLLLSEDFWRKLTWEQKAYGD